MMAQNPNPQFSAPDTDDRRSRFATSNGIDAAGNAIAGRGSGAFGNTGPVSLRERAASQPPRPSDQNFLSSPSATHFIPSSLGGGTAGAWPNSRLNSNRGNQAIPIRSSSFSSNSQSQFSTVMRDRTFPSMIEDDEESDAVSETYDDRLPPMGRGRSYGDPIRSRSHSLATATGRPGPIGSGYLGSPTINSSSVSTSSGPLAIPGRFGDIRPPGPSRYGSLGTLGRSPSGVLSSSPSANLLGNGLNSRGISETNQSPFRRDVGQILLDDASAFREIWAGANPSRDDNGGAGSGTTSRRHSVSIVQARKGIVGFNAPSADDPEEPVRSSVGFGRGNLRLTDDDLLADFSSINLGSNDPPISSTINPPSQPASLPIFAPLSRTPPSRDLLSPYQSLNTMGLPGSYSSRPPIGTPSDSEFVSELDNRNSPSAFDQYPQYGAQQQQERFISGQGLKFPTTGGPSDSRMPYPRNRGASLSSNIPAPGLSPSPISPTSTRMTNPQQQPYYTHQMQRKMSEPMSPMSAMSGGGSQPPSASTNLHNPPLPPFQHVGGGASLHQQQSGSGGVLSHSVSQQSQQHQQLQPNINELGKGVPLHAVPVTCPLFIVEFKAGRTDLFYLTNLNLDVKVGDLVIVEADRGKDLGTVVNDTITITEVEEWQRQQIENAGAAGVSNSPIAMTAAAVAAAAAIGFGLEGGPESPTTPGGSGVVQQGGQGQSRKEINPKMILGKADQREIQMFAAKAQDELKALQLCQSKVKAKKLPMEVIDAEYQWDRRKLTFYFIAEKRIDFRELVRELFRLYKTRIWMASIQSGTVAYEQ